MASDRGGAALSAAGDTPSAPLYFRGHILPLDGLRGAGMLSVLLFHAFYDSQYVAAPGSPQSYVIRLTQLGVAGMIMFFSLSGFLITGILLDSVGRPHYWKNFYVRRALRILPAYLLMLAVLKAGSWISWRFVLACLLYIGNMARLVGAHAQEYGVMWSLAVEEQFYLLWPLVVYFVQRRTLLWLCVAGVVLTPFLRVAFTLVGIETFLNTPSNIDCIVSGALLAILLRNGTIHRGNIRRVYHWLGWLGGLTFLPILFLGIRGYGGHFLAFLLVQSFRQPPVLLMFATFALWAVSRHTKHGPAPSRTLRFFVFFGDISYGIYLVHQLIFHLYDRFVQGTVLDGYNHNFALLWVRCILTSLLATGIAWLSRRYFEDRFLVQKNRLAPYPGLQHPSVPEPGVPPGMEQPS